MSTWSTFGVLLTYKDKGRENKYSWGTFLLYTRLTMTGDGFWREKETGERKENRQKSIQTAMSCDQSKMVSTKP